MTKVKYCAVAFEDGTIIMNPRKCGLKRTIKQWQRHAWTPEQRKIKRFFKWFEEERGHEK